MRHSVRRLMLATALIVVAAPVQGQGPFSTGTFVAGRDQNWDVAVGSGSFVDAYQVAVNPGWQDFSGPTIARWISFNASATNPGGAPYYFRTTFDLTGYDPFSALLSYRCAMDDAIQAVRLNSVAVSGSCQFHALSPVQTIASGFLGGLNTLEFQVAGNGQTDGFIYHTESFSARQVPVVATPEPSSFVLLASGLGALGLVARRRARR